MFSGTSSEITSAESTCCRLSSSVDEVVSEEDVCVTDEELGHDRLNTDALQCSQAVLLLLQVLAPSSSEHFTQV